MKTKINRRHFVITATLGPWAAARAIPAVDAVTKPTVIEGDWQKESRPPVPKDPMPMGKIGPVELSRLMLGGNLISGYSHSRDLTYVSQLMKRYNTEFRILNTLEIAESQGINAINLSIWDNVSFLQKHWKNVKRQN